MSIKTLLGLKEADITDAEIVKKIAEAQQKNLNEVEFDVDGKTVKVKIPHIGFDPHADEDSW